jgi:uncharacterized membrane protein
MAAATPSARRTTGRGGERPAFFRRGARASGHYDRAGWRRLPRSGDERLGRALGWFGLGLGVAQLAAPRGMARLIGVVPGETERVAMRAVGVREIVSGLGILARRRPAAPLWTRVAGDVADLALLGRAFTRSGTRPTRTAAATAAVLGVAALDLFASVRITARARAAREGGVRVTQAITVNRPPEEVYGFWRDLQNLPRFMKHVEAVSPLGDGRSHWTAKGPAGATIEWDAEITKDEPNRLIAWRSLEGADVDNAGAVHFAPAPGNRGTEVRIDLVYQPPAGRLGAAVATLLGEEPQMQIAAELRILKQILETGEVQTAAGPSGRRRRSVFGRSGGAP